MFGGEDTKGKDPSNFIKISIFVQDIPMLFNYNINLPMEDNIKAIISDYNGTQPITFMNPNLKYGMKLMPDPKFNKGIAEHYISEENFKYQIKDGYEMKVVLCVYDTVKEIFEGKTIDNNSLLALSHDKIVIEEIVQQNRYPELIEFILNGKLNDNGESGALTILYHLLRAGYIRDFNSDFVKKVVEIAQNYSSSSTFALSLIVSILSIRRDSLSSNKDIVMENLTVPHVMQHFGRGTETSEKGFFLKIFTLINYMIHCAKAERRSAILLELNTPENREKIYNFLKRNPNLDKKVAREIFILQARLLTNTYFKYYLNQNIRASALYDNSSRSSIISDDFEQIVTEECNNKMKRMDSMLSIASADIAPTELSLLKKCLDYGQTYYSIYFDSTKKSDYSCEAELHSIGQNIIKILTQLFCIGIKAHSNNFYLPLYFAQNKIRTQHGERVCEFFQEIFVKTLMLLFRSKAEMKAKTEDDFKKLYAVVNKQLQIIIKKRPFTFEEWDMISRDITFSKLQEILQEQRDYRWEYLYNNNKCLKDLASHFAAENHEVIKLQRYEVLCKGFIFPNMHYRKGEKNDPANKHTHFFLHLGPGYQKLWYEDYTEHGKLEGGEQYTIDVNCIKHIVIEENCTLIKTKLVPYNKRHLVFTITYSNSNNETMSLDCYFDINQNKNFDLKESKFFDITKDKENEKKKKQAEEDEFAQLAKIWKDGLALLNKQDITKNEDYQAELNELCKMDCAMQLIELQDVEIPIEAPPVPPFPEFYINQLNGY